MRCARAFCFALAGEADAGFVAVPADRHSAAAVSGAGVDLAGDGFALDAEVARAAVAYKFIVMPVGAGASAFAIRLSL